MEPILEGFDSVEDLYYQYKTLPEEGAQILVACYTYEDYEGLSYVLLEKDGQLYEVHGSHCSCYGLEGQWDLELTTVDLIEAMLARGASFPYQVQTALKYLRNRNVEQNPGSAISL